MTPRQRKLLQAIIDEFVETAEAVGSAHLARKYKLNLSPATIRNEMADLVKMGYLEKPHSSSGRVPTTMGYKEFIEDIFDELEDLDIGLESIIREDLFQNRFDIDELIYKAVDKLTAETGHLSFAIIGGRIYYSGLSSMMRSPEFSDAVKLERVLRAIEDHDRLKEILTKYESRQGVKVLFGDDIGVDYYSGTSILYKLIRVHGSNEGFLGLIGPMRMAYNHNIAFVDFIATSINSMLEAW